MAGPDTKNTETPYPIWGFGPPSPEPDTKKLDALLASLNGSAERFQTLWFSFLGLTLYLAIAALATTHRDLLLNNPQTLPILNIKVELLPFYIIAPLLYLVFHFYLLMMLALLARTAAEFDKLLRTTLPGEPERERYRAQVGNALFLQLLVGMKGERSGVNALLMGLIAIITIVLAPLATLVLMQMMFLPYHHLRITWWHRGIVVADLVLIVVMTYRCFFPRGVRKAPLVLGALSRKPRWATAMAFCLLLAVFLVPLVDWLSFRQGRWAGEPRTSSWHEWALWMEGKPPSLPDVSLDYAETANGVVFGLFPDRLKLASETVVGKEKWEKTKEEIVSRGGGFLATIKLDERDLQAADLSGADLRGVSLIGATMRGVDLHEARLDSARVDGAQLQGAVLLDAQLQGAFLPGARLQGANLFAAKLQGAFLPGAGLQGAFLANARLQGADLFGANLQGADLSEAQLQGAYLGRVELQGADLHSAQLQGAALNDAQLQGANISGADLTDSDFNGAFMFRTSVADANLSTAAIRSVNADQVNRSTFGEVLPLTVADVDGWIAAATQFAMTQFTIGNDKEIRKRFDRLDADFQDNEQVPTWVGMEEASLALDSDGAHYRQRLAAVLSDLACSAPGAPYVAVRLIGRANLGWGLLAALGDQLEGVRARLKAGRGMHDTCKGVIGFTDLTGLCSTRSSRADAAPANH
jgi:uncharacterized protein YjbI with pentapeptide repeats